MNRRPTSRSGSASRSAATARADSGRGPSRRRVEHGADRPAPERRPWYRRVPVLVALVVAVVGGLVAAAWFTPVLAVRTTEVVGVVELSEQEVLAALDVPPGQPLPRVDTGGAAARVAAIPKVASARVQRIYPSTIRVTVTERMPVVLTEHPDGTHLLDGEGVDFAVAPPPPGLPKLVADAPGWGDPATAAALEILEAMPPQLREQVGEVAARSISDVSVTLHDGRIVMWGGTDQSARKGAVALPLLTQPGQTYDVSSPDLPTVR